MHTTSWNKVLAKEGLPVNSFFWQVWDFTRKPTRSEETAKDYMLACRLDRKPQIQSLLDILMAYIFLWGNQPLHCSLSCLSLSLMSICLKCCRKKADNQGNVWKFHANMCFPEKYITNPTAVSQEHDVVCQFYDSENSFPHSKVSIVQQFGTICAHLQIVFVHLPISPP